MPKIIYLLGFMGSGKSTLAKQLVANQSYNMIDMDNEIERNQGMSIRTIFEKYGEKKFREIESDFLKSCSSSSSMLLVSTGGGAPCFNNNMEYMNKNGVTIYLKISAEELSDRLWNNRDSRPLIANFTDKHKLLIFVKQKLKERERFYLNSKIVLNSDSISAEELHSAIESVSMFKK